ncbi:MAG: hypothetical protein QGI24_03920 [Kiritimatiellia bacterium]|jgi:cytoskeletal protein RodZ|nr:hypothetical protein [Kiritimatiellia bacterium]MDP6847912.1 hypothetical protein [Kiritimatiellia bacterium]
MTTKKFKLKKVLPDEQRVTFHKGHHVRKATIPEGKRHAIHTKETYKKKKPVSAGLIVGIVMAIVLLASLTGIYLYVKEKQREARLEAYTLRTNREKAAELYTVIPPMVDETADAKKESSDYIEQVRDAVQVVTGTPLPPLPARPKEVKPSGTDTNAPADSESPPEKTESPDSTPVPAPAPTPQPAPDPAEEDNDVDAPAGIMTRRELELRRSGKVPPPRPTKNTTPSKNKGTAHAGPPAALRGRPGLSRNYPPIVVLAHSILEKDEELTEALDELAALQAEAEMERDDAYRDRFSNEAHKRVLRITEIQKAAEALRDTALACIVEIEKNTEKVIAIKVQTLEDRKNAAEAERQRQLKEQHEALVAKEKATVVSLHANAKPFVKKYEFAEPLNLLTGRMFTLKTDEGKKDLQVVIDRFQRLSKLKKFIIDGLNSNPFGWGWGIGAQTKDVRGADDMVVKIVGANVPWQDVSLPQFMKFFNHYLASPSTKMSTKADHTLAIAIFYDDLGMVDEASKNAKEAANMASHLRPQVKRLLPNY